MSNDWKQKKDWGWLADLAEQYPSSADPRFLDGVIEQIETLLTEEREKAGTGAMVLVASFEGAPLMLLTADSEKTSRCVEMLKGIPARSLPKEEV